MADRKADSRRGDSPVPTYFFEKRARAAGAGIVAGVDEAGRGPLAGPVVVAAVVLDETTVPAGLNDSKQVGPEERARLYQDIMTTAEVAVVAVSRERIDRMNILRASLWGMSRAVRSLPRAPDHLLVDGRDTPPGLSCACEPLIGGDGKSVSIAAASIVAKVTRDRLMTRLGLIYPVYGFERHMGYSTRAHFDALKSHGPCPHHRQSFAPVREQQLDLGI